MRIAPHLVQPVRFGGGQWLIGILFGLAAGMLVGCGAKSGPVRLPIVGKVVASNGSLFTGTISFLPADGQSGVAANAAVKDGSFQFDTTNGPTSGKHKIVVMEVPSKAKSLAAIKSAEAAGTPSAVSPVKQYEFTVNVPSTKPYHLEVKLPD